MTSELTPTSARSTAASNPFDPEGIAWQRVSSRLVVARQILAGIFLGLPAIGAAVVAVLVTPWAWIGAAVLALVWLWAATVIWRQVRAIGYVEREDDLLLRMSMARGLERQGFRVRQAADGAVEPAQPAMTAIFMPGVGHQLRDRTVPAHVLGAIGLREAEVGIEPVA